MSDDKDDIQAARAWMSTWMTDLTAEPMPTLLRALDALEREPQWQEGIDTLYRDRDEFKADRDQWRAACLDARIERDNSKATLASCDRARRAAEEECARLRGVVVQFQEARDRDTHLIVELRADRDRLAAQVARVREREAEWSRHALARTVRINDLEEKCERLRGVVACYEDEGEGVTALTADRDRLAADNAELEAALAAQREAMQSCVDSENRLAATVARVKDVLGKWRRNATLTPSEHEAMRRALDGEVG